MLVQNFMVELAEHTAVGPYLLTRPLDPCAFADRYLALHQDDHSSHVAYRIRLHGDRRRLRRFEAAIAACRVLDHEHLLRVEDAQPGQGADFWVIGPFTGDVDGLRTLGKLLREKGGQMNPFEAERALVQILEPMAYAHQPDAVLNGVRPRVVHGPISMDEVLVDRHGRLLIEFYGFARATSVGLTSSRADEAESIRDEVRSVVEMGYQLVTGLRAEEPMIPAGRLVKRIDPRLDAWLANGLNVSGGFATAAEALAALPSLTLDLQEEPEAPSGWGGLGSWGAWGGWGVRSMLDRLRAVRG